MSNLRLACVNEETDGYFEAVARLERPATL
jgi:hypothetical protein